MKISLFLLTSKWYTDDDTLALYQNQRGLCESRVMMSCATWWRCLSVSHSFSHGSPCAVVGGCDSLCAILQVKGWGLMFQSLWRVTIVGGVHSIKYPGGGSTQDAARSGTSRLDQPHDPGDNRVPWKRQLILQAIVEVSEQTYQI